MEDDVACKVAEAGTAGPTKVQVLVDNGEINTNPINGLRDGLKAFFEKMPEGVEMSLYTTAPQGRPIVKPTTDKKKAHRRHRAHCARQGGRRVLRVAAGRGRSCQPGQDAGVSSIVMVVGSNVGAETIKDSDIPDMQQKIIKNGSPSTWC